MIGLGTIANTIAVIIGGGIGLFLKKGIKKSLQDSLLQAMGIAVLFIGIGGTLSQMLVFKDGHLETTGTMLMIFSLLIGTLIGEIINIEAKLEKLGEFARKILHADEQSKFVDAFINKFRGFTLAFGNMILALIVPVVYHIFS